MHHWKTVVNPHLTLEKVRIRIKFKMGKRVKVTSQERGWDVNSLVQNRVIAPVRKAV